MKAIHNAQWDVRHPYFDVINHKTTKFESNSQPASPRGEENIGCYQSQNYKIWKQFTTAFTNRSKTLWLLSITKLQNLKAIHNSELTKSVICWVVINRKTTKFENNSQRRLRRYTQSLSCYQSKNYKIWKQFTTWHYLKYYSILLLSITKLQNLKAIHNSQHWELRGIEVVINHKTIKFESNSQLTNGGGYGAFGCYQSQNYKIWKQFTTVSDIKERAERMLSITKLQNLKAIHNYATYRYCDTLLLSIRKLQNLKAIHNTITII